MAYRIRQRKNIGIVCCVIICQDLVNYHLEKCHFELHSQSKQATEQMATLTLTNLIKCLYLFKPIQQTDICWYQKQCGRARFAYWISVKGLSQTTQPIQCRKSLSDSYSENGGAYFTSAGAESFIRTPYPKWTPETLPLPILRAPNPKMEVTSFDSLLLM